MDYNKVLEYHINKKADITVVCTDAPSGDRLDRYGTIRMNEECRIEEFEEKPKVPKNNQASMGIYIFKTDVIYQMENR